MKNNTTFSKILSFLLSISFILWLGSYISRHLIIYQFFEPKELDLRVFLQNYDLSPVFFVIYPLLITNIICYSLFIILFILYLSFSKIKIKENGWLLIISLIVFVTAPFEVFLMLKDYEVIKLIIDSFSGNQALVLDLIKKRITVLNSFPLIEIFSYILIIYLVVFKPLTKK